MNTERYAEHCAEQGIKKQSHIIAGQDIFVFFLVNHVRHVFGKHRIEGRRRQQRKHKNVEHCTGIQLPLRIAHGGKAQ